MQDRLQRVAINGCYSSWQYINAGVPQGSILDSLLFLLYINDIVDNIQAQVRLFADDTSIFLIVDNAIESADILNRDLNTITSWSNNWLVSFNPQKTETMVISRKVNKPHHPSLIMNNQQLEDVKYHKHLGVTISNDGSWNKHVELVIDKAYSRLNILRMLKFRLDRLSFEKLYLSFIRPLLEYGDVVWDPHNMYLINILEKVQIEVMRITSGGTKLTPLRELYKETGLSKLKDRRENHKLIQLFKMQNDLTPASLSTLIPNRFQYVHTYNTRHNNAKNPNITLC